MAEIRVIAEVGQDKLTQQPKLGILEEDFIWRIWCSLLRQTLFKDEL